MKYEELPEKILERIRVADESLPLSSILYDTQTLLKTGAVEVGWRESCGKTDPTMKAYREWKKIIALLKKQGLEITEERVKHGNSYATNKGGFWNSIIYRIKEHAA